MRLKDEDDASYVARINDESRRAHNQALADAKAEALLRGKEPFDLAKLELLCDTSREGKMDPEEVRWTRFESMYYTHFPEVLTLEEFAAKVEVLNRW